MVQAWEGGLEEAESDLSHSFRRRVQSGIGLGQSLPRGAVALTLFGQAGSGKSTAGNVLVCRQARDGPFEVGLGLKSVGAQVSTAYSPSCNVFVSDTPGLFQFTAGDSKEDRLRSFNEDLKVLTHFLNTDGGLLVWTIGVPRVPRHMRAIIHTLNLCYPAWAQHTMLLCNTVSDSLYHAVEELANAEAGSECHVADADVADRYDERQLDILNSSLKSEGVQFSHLTTFVLGSSAFGALRLEDRVAGFARLKVPIPSLFFATWSSVLERVEETREERLGALQEKYSREIDAAEMQLALCLEAVAAHGKKVAEKDKMARDGMGLSMSHAYSLWLESIKGWQANGEAERAEEIRARIGKLHATAHEEMNRVVEECMAGVWRVESPVGSSE